MTRDYTVIGMSCEHCVRAVQEEVAGIVGVREVVVDLSSGRLAVDGDGFSDADVRAAVEEAGYAVA